VKKTLFRLAVTCAVVAGLTVPVCLTGCGGVSSTPTGVDVDEPEEEENEEFIAREQASEKGESEDEE